MLADLLGGRPVIFICEGGETVTGWAALYGGRSGSTCVIVQVELARPVVMLYPALCRGCATSGPGLDGEEEEQELGMTAKKKKKRFGLMSAGRRRGRRVRKLGPLGIYLSLGEVDLTCMCRGQLNV